MSRIALVLCLAVLTPNQTNKPDKTDTSDHAAAKEKLVPGPVVVGKVVQVDVGRHTLIVRFENVPQLVQQQGYTRATRGPKQVEFHAVDDVKVRASTLPTEFDEKGKPRRYTLKEKRERKGNDPRLPGYQVDFDTLKSEQLVQLTMVKRKPAGRVTPSKKNKDADGDDEKNKHPDRPEVMMIYIVAEPKK
jgi:hypothetical protein